MATCNISDTGPFREKSNRIRREREKEKIGLYWPLRSACIPWGQRTHFAWTKTCCTRPDRPTEEEEYNLMFFNTACFLTLFWQVCLQSDKLAWVFRAWVNLATRHNLTFTNINFGYQTCKQLKSFASRIVGENFCLVEQLKHLNRIYKCLPISWRFLLPLNICNVLFVKYNVRYRLLVTVLLCQSQPMSSGGWVVPYPRWQLFEHQFFISNLGGWENIW